MKIIVAVHAGFCFGVQRAVEMALKSADPSRTCYTLGEIIHNPDVVNSLKEKNIFPVSLPQEVPHGGTLIIRSHGVPPDVYESSKTRGLVVIDATCPFVKRIHAIAKDCAKAGIPLVILAAVIALTRLYVGVHYPSDVITGFLIALLLSEIVWIVYQYISKSRRKEDAGV